VDFILIDVHFNSSLLSCFNSIKTFLGQPGDLALLLLLPLTYKLQVTFALEIAFKLHIGNASFHPNL